MGTISTTNNRCIWDIPSFTVKDNVPDWKVQTSEWNVENTSKWKTEDTDNFFYEIERRNMIDKCKAICCKVWDKIKAGGIGSCLNSRRD